MNKISPIDNMPETKLGWSKKDYIVCDKYNFHIGRTKDGQWVDMRNNPIEDVIFYCDLPMPTEDEYNMLRDKVDNQTSEAIKKALSK